MKKILIIFLFLLFNCFTPPPTTTRQECIRILSVTFLLLQGISNYYVEGDAMFILTNNERYRDCIKNIGAGRSMLNMENKNVQNNQ
ncbi:MAG: hypothetical protein H7A23_08095 [Leptospiraceae bacterium]|nr:hypothetical protein [Leptospiraceae bacterium]